MLKSRQEIFKLIFEKNEGFLFKGTVYTRDNFKDLPTDDVLFENDPEAQEASRKELEQQVAELTEQLAKLKQPAEDKKPAKDTKDNKKAESKE